MKLKNTTNHSCNKKHYDEDNVYYLQNTFTVLAVDGGKGSYITAITNAGPFSNMFTVIKGLPITDKYILVEIVVKGSNYNNTTVNTLFAEAINVPIPVLDYKYISTSWSGSGNEIFINNEHKILLSSYDIQMEILNSFPKKRNISPDSPFYKLLKTV